MIPSPFALGRIDHVHLRVPNRADAVRWYGERLGFEPVERFRFWAEGFDGGPVQISADGGKTTLALFEATDTHPMVPQATGVAFSVDVDAFVAFARSLSNETLASIDGSPLRIDDVIDFDLCWAYEFADPWGNRFEVNCYDYQGVQEALIDAFDVTPQRYWPAELIDQWRSTQP